MEGGDTGEPHSEVGVDFFWPVGEALSSIREEKNSGFEIDWHLDWLMVKRRGMEGGYSGKPESEVCANLLRQQARLSQLVSERGEQLLRNRQSFPLAGGQ